MFYAFIRKLLEIFFRIRYNIVVHGKEKLKTFPKGGYIIACNHQSYADPPAIAAIFKGKFSFMAKSELFEKNKLFAWLIRRCGAFPVVRGAGDNVAIERAIADLKKGKIFIIFPEGTRSKTGEIGRGKSGISLIASAANVPVVPVSIMYGLCGKGRRLDFAVGDMISADELKISGDDRAEIKRVSSRIMGDIKALQQEIFVNTYTNNYFIKNKE